MSGKKSLPLHKRIYRKADRAIDIAVTVICVILILCGAYALYDNAAVTASASSVQWQPYKPQIPNETASFEELQSINPDVVAWLDIYGTNIDYPVVASGEEEFYLTHNAKREYSLTGSLFVDKDNAPDFSDINTIMYGHHMEAEAMFGGLDHFLDSDYFSSHRYGKLYVAGREFGIDVLASFTADAYDGDVYRHVADEHDKGLFAALVASRASQIRIEPANRDTGRIVTLSTCSSDGTNARTLVVCRVTESVPEDTFETWPNTGTGVELPEQMIWGLPAMSWVLIGIAVIAAVALLVLAIATRKKKRKDQEEELRSFGGYTFDKEKLGHGPGRGR